MPNLAQSCLVTPNYWVFFPMRNEAMTPEALPYICNAPCLLRSQCADMAYKWSSSTYNIDFVVGSAVSRSVWQKIARC